MSDDALRAEHDAVLTSLSTRESTRHFAHAAVSGVVVFILGGTTGKLWHDFAAEHPEWTWVAGAFTASLSLYALVRLGFGFRAYKAERTQLERLKELRKALGVDAPASLSTRAS